MKKSAFFRLSFAFYILLLGCCTNNKNSELLDNTNIPFYYGADLSYVNEMEDCGAIYRNDVGQQTDPYQIFKDVGANLVRLRLWHNP